MTKRTSRRIRLNFRKSSSDRNASNAYRNHRNEGVKSISKKTWN